MRKSLVFGIAAVMVVVGGILAFRSITSSAGNSLQATITGAEEVPPVNTTASGQAVFELSADGMSMTFTLTVNGISDVTSSHIHLAPRGSNGPVVVSLLAAPQSGMFSGVLAQGTITTTSLRGSLLGQPLSALVTQINSGNAYVNIHTNAHPAGEIRGQITMSP